MKIYTKTGDKGQTSLFGGQRVSKTDLRIEAYGTVDELNSIIGLIVTKIKNQDISNDLRKIQNELFILGADLATPAETVSKKTLRISDEQIAGIELLIDKYSAILPELRVFILPGGTEGAAFLHIARTVCRRAERLCVSLSNSVEIGSIIIIYLNRLSDLLFVLARAENQYLNWPDAEWQK